MVLKQKVNNFCVTKECGGIERSAVHPSNRVEVRALLKEVATIGARPFFEATYNGVPSSSS